MMRHFNKPEMKETRRYLRRKQTYCEKLIWMYLRNRRFLGCKFRRQYSVDSFVIDFYCPELKLAIEIDGEIHELDEQMIKDKTRQEYLESYGIHFLRIRNDALLGHPDREFKRIEDVIKKLSRPHP